MQIGSVHFFLDTHCFITPLFLLPLFDQPCGRDLPPDARCDDASPDSGDMAA